MALLSVDTLTGTRIGISASNSDDLDRLGLLEGHFNLALGELARTTLLLGGRLQYCGHLRPDGVPLPGFRLKQASYFLRGEHARREHTICRPLCPIRTYSLTRSRSGASGRP